MDIESLNRRIRSVITDTSISNWHKATDKQAFCRDLLGPLEEHDLIVEIMTEVVQDLMARKAEDRFAQFCCGDGVSILGQGLWTPATVVAVNADTVTVELDGVDDEYPHSAHPSANQRLTFVRSHDQVFIRMEGHQLSRLVLGRKKQDYTTERMLDHQKRFSKLTRAS